MSDRQEDHVKYGVVDPSEHRNVSNSSALGTRLTLTNRKGDELGNLIVGFPVKNNDENQLEQRFARVTGQPNVYVIKYEGNYLTTDLSQWISSNPLQLKMSQSEPGQTIASVTINNYRLEVNQDNKVDNRTDRYVAELATSGGNIGLARLAAPSPTDPKKMVDLPVSAVAENQAMQQALSASLGQLASILTADVKRKSPAIAKAITDGADVDNQIFKTLEPFGFYKSRMQDGYFECESTFGNIEVHTGELVKLTISFGNIARAGQGGRLLHYVMINAALDADRVPQVEKPADLKDDDRESETYKAYRRQLDEVKNKVDFAKRMASQINELHSEWIYLLIDGQIEAIRPELQLDTLVSSAIKE